MYWNFYNSTCAFGNLFERLVQLMCYCENYAIYPAIKATFTIIGYSFSIAVIVSVSFSGKIYPFTINIFLVMNSSQLLYKISNLKYTIRMKEFEYNDALNANDKLKMDLHNASLILLKEDLNETIKEFDSIQTDSSNGKTASPKNPRKWPNIFNFRAAFTNKK